MTVEQLYDWLVDNSYNALAANVNQAAGLMADAMSEPGGELFIKERDEDDAQPDVPDPDDG